MPKPSSIKSLPQKLQDQVNRLLVDESWSLDKIVEYLEEAGHPRSRSALGRYGKEFKEVAAKINESREMAAALGQEIGPDLSEGKFGRLLIEILQKLCFDHLLDQAKSDTGSAPMDLMRLAKALKDMAGAQKIDTDREINIRNDERNKAVTESAEAGEKVLTKAGVSQETINKFRSEILGITT